MSLPAAGFPRLAPALVLSLAFALPAAATVVVSGPADGLAYFPLYMPTGQFDERGLSGFEFLISSATGPFDANDQYLIQGEDTNPTQAIGSDLGTVADLSGVPFDFSIRHNLVGGRNFTFSLTNTVSSQVSVLCWGQNCAAGATSAELINGLPPIIDYNGIQVQVRAQDVPGASVAVEILGLSGVTLSGAPLFDETVVPSSPGTILPFDQGRRGQWFMADANELTESEWELFGRVILNRIDPALTDRTKVRLAVDLVRNPSLPFVPEPSTGILLGGGLAGLAAWRRRPGSADIVPRFAGGNRRWERGTSVESTSAPPSAT
jgi:hypothetical protein